MSDPDSLSAADYLESYFEVGENDSGRTYEPRQEAYSKRDRDLLTCLVAEFDTDNILFSNKRDSDTSARKKE
jgi:hypothetical protein